MKYLKFLLPLAFLFSVPLFSLSQEEREALPDLSKAELIEIILIYDETLTKIEQETEKREQTLNEREIDLTKREERQSAREASSVVREQLLVESLKLQKEKANSDFWRGFGYGSLAGLFVGETSGIFIGSQFK